jgi:glutamate racemase
MKLGILDWGVGGLFALDMARRREPALDLVYLSDSGNTPYGKQSRAQLTRSVEAACRFLEAQGATGLLVACHSASTVLPERAVGVIRPESVPTEAREVLVLGGARTIRSGLWRRALERPGRRIQQRIAQPLSAHIEAGTQQAPEALAELDRILAPVGDPDVVVLACTHYPAMAAAIRERLPGSTLVDPAELAVGDLGLQPGSGRVEVFTTGPSEPLVRALARRGLGALAPVAIPNWRMDPPEGPG